MKQAILLAGTLLLLLVVFATPAESQCDGMPDGTPCDDGLYCNGSDTCRSGACTQHTGDPCNGPDGDADCSESCDEVGDDCTASDPNGSVCDDGSVCTVNDACAGGACTDHDNAMDGTPCDDGLFCNGTESCQAGSCTGSTGDPCDGPDGDADCSESCDETGDSCTAADPNGSACDDGLFCNGIDTCQSGSCSHTGDPCNGPDGDADCLESCVEASDTCDGADPNGSTCDDGLFCNGTESCQAGACAGSTGDPCNGPDGDFDCSESCDEAGDSCTAADPNGSVCDDGSACTVNDACAGGACTDHDNAMDGTPCDDGLFCNGTESCQAGSCAGSTGDPCDGPDGDADCSESCNEVADNCDGADPNGSSCDDGLFCNGSDTCQAGSCSHTGDPCDGPDGDFDCSESCDETGDSCTAADPNGSACDDGSVCTVNDTCAGGTCTDHDNAMDGTPCDDGLFCNGTESCQAGACAGSTGDPCDGPDGDADCSESCNEAADNCDGADPNGSTCDDGQFCNGSDTCQSGSCAHTGDPCDGPDGDSDCSESCDEATDRCDGADPNGSTCDDGQFCNGSESCQAGTCSGSTGDPCDGPDGDSDCSESCNEAIAGCTAPDPESTVWGVDLSLGRSMVTPGDLELSWEPNCGPSPDYAVYEGLLGEYTSHIPAGLPICTTGGDTSTTLTPGTGDRYYLVVPLEPAAESEGSYGFESDGTPRDPSISACEALTDCNCPG